MRRLENNAFFTLDYEQAATLFIQRWRGELTEESYKENMLKLVEWAKKLAPIRFHVVYPHADFVIAPELQLWTKANVFEPCVAYGLERAAFIFTKDIMASLRVDVLSIEQTIEEGSELFAIQYFTDEQQARDWFAKA